MIRQSHMAKKRWNQTPSDVVMKSKAIVNKSFYSGLREIMHKYCISIDLKSTPLCTFSSVQI